MSHQELSDLDHAEARDLLARALGEEPSMKLDPQAVLVTAKRSLRRGRTLMVTGAIAGVMLAGFGTTAVAGGFSADSVQPASNQVVKKFKMNQPKCLQYVTPEGKVTARMVSPGAKVPEDCQDTPICRVLPGQPDSAPASQPRPTSLLELGMDKPLKSGEQRPLRCASGFVAPAKSGSLLEPAKPGK